MLTINEMKKIRTAKGLSYEEIAKLSGVSVSSVQKLFGGENANPRRTTIEKLNQAFNSLDIYLCDISDKKDQNLYENKNEVQEPGARYTIYGKNKMVSGGYENIFSRTGYTYEDYLALELPEGKRVEIIDGIIYDMASSSYTHQAISGYINNFLNNELRKRKRRCLSFASPVDVRLDYSDGPTTVVQPDIVIKCSEELQTDEDGNEIPWIPRFVIEIISKSSKTKDMYIKTKKYRESGIQEYWIINNKKKQVIKHNFLNETIEVFGYNEKVPIDIFNGDIQIDMKELEDYLHEYADILGITDNEAVY